MESYMEINRGITMSNQHLRIKIGQLNAELIRVNERLMDERAAHRDQNRKIINILSDSVNRIMNEIVPDYYGNENNVSETLSRSLFCSSNNSPSRNINKCNKSPIQIQNHLLKNVTLRRNIIQPFNQNKSRSQNYVDEKGVNKYPQRHLLHQECDEAIITSEITNRERNSEEIVPQQLLLATEKSDNTEDANDEELCTITEEDTEEENYSSVLSGQNEITIFNMQNVPCSTPQNGNLKRSKNEFLEIIKKNKLVIRVKRLKLSNSSKNNISNQYSSFDTTTANTTSIISESRESSNNDTTILSDLDIPQGKVDKKKFQSIINDTNINSTSIMSAESLQSISNNLTLTNRPKRKAGGAIKSYAKFFD